MYDEVQDIMRGGKSRKITRCKNNPEFPLRGVECECGGHISGAPARGRGGKYYRYYGCTKKKKDCQYKRAIPKKELEDNFTQFLYRYEFDEDLIDALREALKIIQKQESESSENRTVALERKIKKPETEVEELFQMRLDGTINNESFITDTDKRNIQKRELETELKKLTANNQEELEIELGLRLVQQFPSMWQELEPAELRLILNSIFPKNIQYTKSGFQTSKLAPVYKVKSASGDDKNRLVTLRGIEPRFRA